MAKISSYSPHSDPEVRDPYLGMVLGHRYHLTQLLGSGAMGRVYLAEDHQLGQVKVAVKLLSQSLMDPKAQQRFQREAQTGAFLGQKSLHIVRVNDYGITPEGIPYSVMEYLPGLTLRQVLEREGSLELARVVRLARHIALGLQAAHEGIELEGRRVKVIHRDLKPANVMLLRDPSLGEMAKILDFGIAKLQDPIATASITHAYVGTLAYSSPEQLEGVVLDGRADLYSFGVMVYQMLTGELPILPATDSYPAWYQAHHKMRPEPFSRMGVDVPKGLADVVMACLSKHPDQRPPSAQAVAAYLKQWEEQLLYGGGSQVPSSRSQSVNPGLFSVVGLQGRGGTMRLADQSYAEPHPLRDRLVPLIMGSALALLCLTVGWGVVSMILGGSPRTAQRPTPPAQPAPEQPLVSEGTDPNSQAEAYQAAMQAGQAAFDAEDYDTAREQFELALEMAGSQAEIDGAQNGLRELDQQIASALPSLDPDTDSELFEDEGDPNPPPWFEGFDPVAQSPELLGQILDSVGLGNGGGSPSPISLQTFPISASQGTVRNVLGDPQGSGTGYWPNTVFDLYNFESPLFSGRIDLGLIYDRDTLRLRQSEVTVTDGVPDEAAQLLLSNLLQGDPPAPINASLQSVRQGQSNQQPFQHNGLQGVIERNQDGNVYMAVWEPDLHQTASQPSVNPQPVSNPQPVAQPQPVGNRGNQGAGQAPGQALQDARQRARDRR